jgi:hypothetical protein
MSGRRVSIRPSILEPISLSLVSWNSGVYSHLKLGLKRQERRLWATIICEHRPNFKLQSGVITEIRLHSLLDQLTVLCTKISRSHIRSVLHVTRFCLSVCYKASLGNVEVCMYQDQI